MEKADSKISTENIPEIQIIRAVSDSSIISKEAFNLLRIFRLKGSYCLNSKEEYIPHFKCCGVKKINFLAPYINIKTFVVFLSIFVFFQSSLINGSVNFSIISIEMRYRLTTFESGLIASMYDIANILFAYPVTYFGGYGRKPTWLGYGTLFFGVGCFIYCLPQFISGKYLYSKMDYLCFSNVTQNTQICSSEGDFMKLKRYKWFFYGAMFTMGLGGTSLYTLGYNYVDENANKYESTVYFAILNTFAIIGPAVGFLSGSGFLKVYVDFEKGIWPTDISSKDQFSWIGAYWIPFMITLVISVFISVPIMCFPSFTSSENYKKYCNSISRQPNVSTNENRSFLNKMLESKATRYTKEIVTNVHFTLLAVTSGLEFFILSAVSTLGAKYLVSRFNVDTSIAGLYIGLSIIPASILALTLSAFIIKRFKIRSHGLTRLVLIFSFIPIPFFLTSLLECQSIKILGFTEKDLGSCSLNCSCSREISHFSPVCGNDGHTYFSPCFAGCQTALQVKSDKSFIFKNCSCISGSFEGKPGTCDSSCPTWKIILFILSMSVLIFSMYFCMVPVISLTLTSLRPEVRPLALGIKACYVRMIGTLPGPPIAGLLFDNACIHHFKKCGNDGNCAVFNSDILSLSFVGLLLGLKCSTAIMYGILWWIWNDKYEVNDDYGDKPLTPDMCDT